MNTELKPGMMALVVGCVHTTENIGKIVELISFIKKGDRNSSGHVMNADSWEIKGDNLFSMTVLAGTDILRSTSFGERSNAAPNHLMPIKQQSDPIHAKEEKHASA